MKAFVIQLLSIVFVLLITGSIQSVTADHSEPDQGIFKNEQTLQELEATKDSNYQIYLQTVLRNGDGQLISVIEGTHGFVIPHQISDHVFDTLMGKKEIVIIDDIKYEKVQYTFSPTLKQRWIGMYPIFEEVPIKIKVEEGKVLNVYKDHSLWKMHYCADFSNIGHDGLQCIPVFQVLVPNMTLEPTDVVTHHWTILRELN